LKPTLLIHADEFLALAEDRERAGVHEYRGGDESAPFAGDALACKLEEHADALNYLRHAAIAAGHGPDHLAWPEDWQEDRRRTIQSALWTQRRMAARRTPRSLDCTA
jgi:hypothetical protein